MRKRIKKVLICLCVFSFHVIGSEKVSASSISVISDTIPCVGSSNIKSAASNLTLSNSGSATIRADLFGKLGSTTKITAIIKLQRYNKTEKKWKLVKSWEKTANKYNLSFSKVYQLSKNGKYRARVIANIWNGSTSEKVIKNSTTKTY